jgi:hypothetical protein
MVLWTYKLNARTSLSLPSRPLKRLKLKDAAKNEIIFHIKVGHDLLKWPQVNLANVLEKEVKNLQR